VARPSRPTITRAEIIVAALAVIDAEGYEKLSLDRIAKWVGVKAPSLYYHFKNKEEILASVARYIVSLVPMPPDLPMEFSEQYIISGCISLRSEILKHPRAAKLFTTYFPAKSIMPIVEQNTKRFLSLGIPTEMHMMVFEGLQIMTVGSALQHATQRMSALSGNGQHSASGGLAAAMVQNRWHDDEIFIEMLRSFLRGAVERAGDGKAQGLSASTRTEAKTRSTSNSKIQ
jgi:TetR/AcrR family transcriptional regulator, tetracycline repressor protein